MIIAQPKAGAYKGKYQYEKGDNGHDGRTSSPPTQGYPRMQESRIKQPGNQGPHLFWIPLPVTAKDGLGINGPGNHPDGQKGEAIHQGKVIDCIQGFQ
jgi:hypothetical protein